MSMEMPNAREVLVKDLIAKTSETVPAGQEWQVTQLLKSEIVVKAGAKLTVNELAAKNKITVEEGGELEILGENLENEIIQNSEQSQIESKTETLHKFEKALDVCNKLEMVKSVSEVQNLVKEGVITQEMADDFLEKDRDLKATLILSILKWPETSRKTVVELLKIDTENPDKLLLETYIKDALTS